MALFKLPQLLLLDAQTLQRREQRDWLQYACDLTLNDGLLLSWSRVNDKERDLLEQHSIFKDCSRVVFAPLAGGATREIELPDTNLNYVAALMPGQLLISGTGKWDMVEGVIDGEQAGGMAFANGSLGLLDLASGKPTELLHFDNGLNSLHRDPQSGILYVWTFTSATLEQEVSPELQLLRLE